MVDHQPREVSQNDLVLWGAFRPPAAVAQLVLADGGLLVADIVGLQDDLLRLDVPLAGAASIPVESVAGILFHPPGDPLRRDQLADRLAARDGDSDLLILENGDELSGTVTGLAETSLQFSLGAAPIKITLERVVALRFNPKLVERPRVRPGRVWVGLSDGTRLLADTLEWTGAEATVSLASGQDLHVSGAEIVAVQPLGNRTVYLSDLKPAGYVHIPFLSLSWPYTADRNVLGGRLRSGGRLYAKGIGMHSASRLTYRIDRKARRFAAEIALDDAAGQEQRSRGSVVFRVFVDKEERFASPVIRGGEPPVPVSVELKQGSTLSLLVDFGDRGDELDHANWLNARFEE